MPLQSPSLQASIVNILWFISLVLSLTAVLIGTVALQWLREHQRYPRKITPPMKFAIFNMRRKSIKEWYVPQIFQLLPMLLQVALILFFAGLVEFLLLIAPPRVFAPIIAFIGLPILFLFLTTLLPSFQWLISPAIHVRLFRRVPSPCPYKSPQSSACRFVVMPTMSFIRQLPAIARHIAFKGLDGILLKKYWKDYQLPFHLRCQAFHLRNDMALYYREVCHELLAHKTVKTIAHWHSMEGLAHHLRTNGDPGGAQNAPPPIYECIFGLRGVYKRRPDQEESIYHCLEDIPGEYRRCPWSDWISTNGTSTSRMHSMPRAMGRLGAIGSWGP